MVTTRAGPRTDHSAGVSMQPPSNRLVDEYLELWDDALAMQDEYLSHVIDAGLATTQAKITVDTLDLIREQHEQIHRMKRELTELDETYRTVLAQLKDAGNDTNSQSMRALGPRDEARTRISDFLMGIIISLQRDFSKSPDLLLAVQQIYLFSEK